MLRRIVLASSQIFLCPQYYPSRQSGKVENLLSEWKVFVENPRTVVFASIKASSAPVKALGSQLRNSFVAFYTKVDDVIFVWGAVIVSYVLPGLDVNSSRSSSSFCAHSSSHSISSHWKPPRSNLAAVTGSLQDMRSGLLQSALKDILHFFRAYDLSLGPAMALSRA